ncbi:MAG: hypothetical protein H0W90_08105 [Actinobacteria bacterium]|nr:hypothetical protein [Actinomycetota bacterium]
MKRLFRGKRKLVAAPLAVLAFAGVAFAAWTLLNVTGQGGVKGGTLANPTIAATFSGVQGITPGNSGDVGLAINNPNGAMVLTHLAPNVGGNGDTSACPALSIKDTTGLTIAVPAGASTVIVPNGAQMASSAPTSCQNAQISLGVVADFSTP